jgi:hypothetical protein
MTHTFEFDCQGRNGRQSRWDGCARDKGRIAALQRHHGTGWPVGAMIILSRHVMCKGEILEPASGEPVRFCEA